MVIFLEAIYTNQPPGGGCGGIKKVQIKVQWIIFIPICLMGNQMEGNNQASHYVIESLQAHTMEVILLNVHVNSASAVNGLLQQHAFSC